MLGVHWKALNKTTVILYVLILVFLPFSPTFSSILLFALFSLWSRLPGGGVPIIGKWFFILDTVDVFSLIIAVNVSGFVGALFSVILNFGGAAYGKYSRWTLVCSDGIAQFFVCLIIPFVHTLTGSIFVSMIWYTIIRSFFLFFLGGFIFSPLPFPQFVLTWIGWSTLLLFVNSFYAGLFGTLFDDLLLAGIDFSWTLFFIVSIIICVGWLYLKKLRSLLPQNNIY